MKRIPALFMLCLAALCCPFRLAAAPATVLFLGGANDSDMGREAFAELDLPAAVAFEHYYVLVNAPELIQARAQQADIVVINALVKELRDLAATLDFDRTILYAFSSRRLPGDIPAREPPEIQAYRATRRPENLRNLIRWIVNGELDPAVSFEPPLTMPEIGVTHPAADRIFPSVAACRAWGLASGHFREGAGTVAFAVHAASINPAELALFRHLTDAFEREGLNVAIVYGDEVRVIRELLLDPDGGTTVDALLALSFKFKSGLGEPLRQALRELDLPVINALRLYRQTTPEWEVSQRGMNDFSVAFGFIAPEISGLIEPTLLFGARPATDAGGNMVQIAEPFPAQIRLTAQRLRRWIGLRQKSNAEKRVALFVYNGAGGKQAIGASYLNVPRSLCRIAGALAAEGYQTGGLESLDEESMTRMLLAHARNTGSWAPGELDAFLEHAEAVRLPRATYAAWFAELPETFRHEVVSEWGEPDEAAIMTAGDDFILPMLRRGNVVILPEPMRGWNDDPHKLVHSPTLLPHHQYLAAYLWLRHEFGADAMIHLGRHGSSEWLPGKQLGLAADSAPMIVRGDIPEIYPYISDGIGEGIVAKRRAAAVMIDHLVPFLQVPEDDGLLAGMQARITAVETADPAVKEQRIEALFRYANETGLAEKLELTRETPGWEHRLEHYLAARQAPAPFGLHTFGDSPSEAEADAMLGLIAPDKRAAAAPHLRQAGRDEMDALMRALSGRFIPPGPSGDPLRNPESLPVGRNFYSFDPARIPTREAVETGRRMAEELLARELENTGRLPQGVAIVLWAGETTRTDGVNEALALALLGMTPQYDAAGRVTGVIPVPGAQLGRPRVDVLLTTSGAYRDQFGDLIRLLDQAQRQAAGLTDAENFIRRNNAANAARLREQGYLAEEAAELAARRVFFPAPGTYGTRVNKLAGASGLWESDAELAALYLDSMGYSIDAAGEIVSARAALDAGVMQVESVVHSRSGNVYGVTDIDDMYQYLGGLSLAVRTTTGQAPAEYIIDQRSPGGERVTNFRSFLRAELDSRLFNPAWLKAMLAENYAGGQTLARTADNLWGWQAVTPDNVSAADWNDLYEILVEDRYGLGMQEFFATHNEWALQSMTARMLEAVRKEYWDAASPIRASLAAAYAQSVLRQGMACCDHTCNNPLLNQMVLNLISVPGVLSPVAVLEFRLAVEQAAARELDAQVRDRRELQQRLAESFSSRGATSFKSPAPAAPSPADRSQPEGAPEMRDAVPVRGFRMEPELANAAETSLSSSGLQWSVLAAVFALIGIFAWGAGRREL